MSKAAKAVKASTKPSVDESVSIISVASTSEPVVEKKVTKARKPKATQETTASTTTATTVSAPITVTTTTETVVEASSAPAEIETTDTSIIEQSLEFNAKLQQLSSLISSLKTEYRNLEKRWQKEIKTSQKLNSRRKRKTGNRAPSGFVKPTRISDELASFLGKEKGIEMARTSVTRDINTYIRANNLQDKENGRQINPDDKLASLLKLEKTDVLTYFNLQRYMSQHFAKSVKATAAAAALATTTA